jgi:hypothetical protein
MQLAVEDLWYCYANNIDLLPLFMTQYVWDVDVFGTKGIFLNHIYEWDILLIKIIIIFNMNVCTYLFLAA